MLTLSANVVTRCDVIALRTRLGLETEKAQRDADMRIHNSDVLTLQKEYDAVSSSLKQLESQKCEAQKRLDELANKVGGPQWTSNKVGGPQWTSNKVGGLYDNKVSGPQTRWVVLQRRKLPGNGGCFCSFNGNKCDLAGVSACQRVSVSACQCVSVSACQCVSVSACQRVSVSACQRVGVSVMWSVWRYSAARWRSQSTN